MPKFQKGSPEAKAHMEMVRSKRASPASKQEPDIMCPHCQTSMTGGKINIGKAFKKLGRDIKRGFEKEIIPVANKAGDYITAKKGGLATDLIRFGIPAVTGATLGALGTLAGPLTGVAGSALGSKLGSMAASELREATGTGVHISKRLVKGSPEAKARMAAIRAMKKK